MKTVKTSLVLLVLFFGLTTFGYPQFLPEPVDCTGESLRGTWIDIGFRPAGGDIRWFFDPFRIGDGDEEGNVACLSTSGPAAPTCSGIYPDGEPFRYTLEEPGRIRILFFASGVGPREITFSCVRFADTLTLRSPDSITGGYELVRPFGDNEFASVPTLSEWGLIAMAGVLGIVGLMVIRRKRVTL